MCPDQEKESAPGAAGWISEEQIKQQRLRRDGEWVLEEFGGLTFAHRANLHMLFPN
jgi:hypothetical protein